MRWTKEQYADYIAKDKRRRARPIHEEQQDVDGQKANHKARTSDVDGDSHPKFRVAITLYVSDARRRDADGALTTILDCLVHAVRRFGGMD